MKKRLGEEIKKHRQLVGVSTYDLDNRGIHASLPTKIERGKSGYTMNTLETYLKAIDPEVYLTIKKDGPKKELNKEVIEAFSFKEHDFIEVEDVFPGAKKYIQEIDGVEVALTPIITEEGYCIWYGESDIKVIKYDQELKLFLEFLNVK